MLPVRLAVHRLMGAHPVLVDSAAALLVTGVTVNLAHGSYPATGVRPFDRYALALTLLAHLPLALRRKAPAPVLLVTEAALLVYQASGYWLGLNQLGVQIALFSLASRGPRRWAAVGTVLVAVPMLYGNVHTWTGSVLDIVVLTLAWLVAISVAGDIVRRLREYAALVAESAERLRAEQRERERQAVLLDRVRIAREMHDIVAHHMSVVAVQAGLARYVLATDPATAEKALQAISEMSSEALDEVRRLVSVLRPDPGSTDAGEPDDRETPGVDDLAAMIERVGLTGVAVEFTVTGTAEPLPAGVGLCLYRVVQESLTNAIKHAPGARVAVSLHYAHNQVVGRVGNDARTGRPGPHPPSAGGGKGLVGMRERAMLYGGTLSAGEVADGGFEVVVTLPIRAAGNPAPALEVMT